MTPLEVDAALQIAAVGWRLPMSQCRHKMWRVDEAHADGECLRTTFVKAFSADEMLSYVKHVARRPGSRLVFYPEKMI